MGSGMGSGMGIGNPSGRPSGKPSRRAVRSAPSSPEMPCRLPSSRSDKSTFPTSFRNVVLMVREAIAGTLLIAALSVLGCL